MFVNDGVTTKEMTKEEIRQAYGKIISTEFYSKPFDKHVLVIGKKTITITN